MTNLITSALILFVIVWSIALVVAGVEYKKCKRGGKVQKDVRHWIN